MSLEAAVATERRSADYTRSRKLNGTAGPNAGSTRDLDAAIAVSEHGVSRDETVGAAGRAAIPDVDSVKFVEDGRIERDGAGTAGRDPLVDVSIGGVARDETVVRAFSGLP